MLWKPILSFNARPVQLTRKPRHGWIQEIMASPHVLIHDCEHNTTRHLEAAWIERIPFIADCVRNCTCFRIECDILDESITRLILCVDEQAFLEQITTTVTGETSIIGLICSICRDAYIPDVRIQLHETETKDEEEHTLYDHQVQSLRWMKQIEHDVKSTRFVEYSKRISIGDTGWFVDIDLEMLVDQPKIRGRRIRGGILADGTGTGKTAVALRLISTPQPIEASIFQYNSKATLVIVPINIPNQWLGEVAKFCNNLRLIRLLQSKDLKGLHMQDLLQADIVLTTFHFLRCSKYAELVDSELTPTGSRRGRAAIMSWARQANRTAPIIEAVHWHRIIVDEIHETFENSRDLRLLKQLNFQICWGLSATPRLHESVQKQFYFFLSVGEKDSQHEPHLLKNIIQHIVRGNPSHLEKPENSLNLVRLTAEERIVLQAHNELNVEDIVKLCSFLTTDEDDGDYIHVCDASVLKKRIHEVKTLRIELLKAQLSEHDRSIAISTHAKNESRIAYSELSTKVTEAQTPRQRRIADHQLITAEQTLTTHETQLQSLVQERNEIEASLDECERSLRFVTSRIDRLESHEDVCPICLERKCSVITKCGHLYCRVCISRHLKRSTTCPECRQDTHIGDLQSVAVGGVGSKLSALASLIQRIDESVIVFAQWKSMLKSMKAVFRGFDLKVYMLEGNTNQRANALAEFSEQGGTLLLSMDDSFAGLHLPCARHIIFSHALLGDSETVRIMEEQAIARSLRTGQTRNVYVYSFIVADCAEEELWRATH